MAGYRRILVVPDAHIPFHHIDTFKFLRDIKNKFKPDKVVCLGDELDFSALSYHESSTELPNANDELNLAKKYLKELFKIFPKVDVLESNHGSMVYRKAITGGLPRQVIRSYNEILGAPKGWQWHDKLVLKASNGKRIYFCHNRSKNSLANSKNVSMNFIQGHHHSNFDIQYWANELDIYWGMTCGCLVDKSSLAFAYGKTTKEKPIIGCAMIIDGIPQLIPMKMDRHGRYVR